jgi:hypothetical protein
LIEKLHTFAIDATDVVRDDIASWVASEFSGTVVFALRFKQLRYVSSALSSRPQEFILCTCVCEALSLTDERKKIKK